MAYDCFQRNINYLRVSVTDKCNRRCRYCMPAEGIALKGHEEILSLEEIFAVVEYAVGLGFEKIRLTGKKAQMKEYDYYTHFPGGHKYVSFEDMMARKPEKVVELAVQRMLPKNKLGRKMLRKLKVYRGGEHEHQGRETDHRQPPRRHRDTSLTRLSTPEEGESRPRRGIVANASSRR